MYPGAIQSSQLLWILSFLKFFMCGSNELSFLKLTHAPLPSIAKAVPWKYVIRQLQLMILGFRFHLVLVFKVLQFCLLSFFKALWHLTPCSTFLHTDLDRDPLVKGKQVVEIKHTLKEPRSLADSVLTTGHTRELHQRDTRWKQANGELNKKFHKFTCFLPFF